MPAYDIAKIVVFGFLFVLGLIMTVFPKKCTREDLREDPTQVAKLRKGGIVMMICGALLIVMTILM